MNHKAVSQRKIRFKVWSVLVLLLLLSCIECLCPAFSEENKPSVSPEKHPGLQEHHETGHGNMHDHQDHHEGNYLLEHDQEETPFTGHFEAIEPGKHPEDTHYTESRHGESNHSPEEYVPSDPVPMTYRVYWISLIILAVLILGYFLIMYRKEKIRLFPSLTVLLFLLAIFLYIMEQLPFFAGYFEPAKGFISGYHEPNTMGFLRFLYKLLLGIGLCIYGFIIFFSHQERKYKP